MAYISNESHVSIKTLVAEINALYQTHTNIGTVDIPRVQQFISKVMDKIVHDQGCFVVVMAKIHNEDQREKCMLAIATRLATYFQLLRKAHAIIVMIESEQSVQVDFTLLEQQLSTLKMAHAALDRFEVYSELKAIILDLRRKVTFY